MRIYVDFDDVLCKTAQALAVLAKEMFGRNVAFEQIHNFDLQLAFSLDRAQNLALMDRAHAPDFLLALAPMPGAAAGVRKWLGRGHEVVVVTGRPATTHRVSRDWLDRQGLASLPVLYVDKYNRNHPTSADAPPFLSLAALLQEHFDVSIDDSPMALDALQTRPTGRIIVFDQPWNRAYECSAPRITRCRGWDELAAIC